MRTIVFIGTNQSGSSREAIITAERLGYSTVLFTNIEKHLWQREEYPDVHQMISVDINNIDDLRKNIKSLQSQGKEISIIVSFIDPYVHIASTLADEFCHNHVSTNAIIKMENKLETRYSLRDMKYTPNFIVLQKGVSFQPNLLHPTMTYPLMVKSPNSTGSKDVLFAKNEKKLETQISKLKHKYPDEMIIIEEYINGDQYLVEALVVDHNLQIAAVVQQEITQRQRFIVTGYSVLADVPQEIYNSLYDVINSIVLSLNMKNGALHVEMRLTEDGWKLIEINPRISGGAMNRMLKEAFGFNLVEETLKLYLGEKPNINKLYKKFVFTQYITLSTSGLLLKVTGKNRAKRLPGIIDVYVKPLIGSRLSPPLSMGHRYAYVMATASSKDEARRYAKEAAKEIVFHLMPV